MKTDLVQSELFWEAVIRRDASMEGQFVYAVTSTGVFCRPTCPSRRPRRDRVQFFADASEAQLAGFRACLRCRPMEAPSGSIEEVCRYIEHHLDDDLSLAALARVVGLSPFHLQRKFKAAVGVTPREYADSCRLKTFKQQLKTADSVTTAIYDAGYGSSSRAYERAPSQLGMTPSDYRRGAASVQIRYAIEDSPIGPMLIAGAETGVCAIQFGDSEQQLVRSLKAEFPNATIHRDELFLHPWAEHLTAYLRGESPSIDLPLDIQATAFQRLVWNYLRSIPYGSTQSYAEVASGIGRPAAARAVARACASNRLAVAIPCHRVVRNDGTAGGYRWGLERKQKLLALENKH